MHAYIESRHLTTTHAQWVIHVWCVGDSNTTSLNNLVKFWTKQDKISGSICSCFSGKFNIKTFKNILFYVIWNWVLGHVILSRFFLPTWISGGTFESCADTGQFFVVEECLRHLCCLPAKCQSCSLVVVTTKKHLRFPKCFPRG